MGNHGDFCADAGKIRIYVYSDCLCPDYGRDDSVFAAHGSNGQKETARPIKRHRLVSWDGNRQHPDVYRMLFYHHVPIVPVRGGNPFVHGADHGNADVTGAVP